MNQFGLMFLSEEFGLLIMCLNDYRTTVSPWAIFGKLNFPLNIHFTCIFKFIPIKSLETSSLCVEHIEYE